MGGRSACPAASPSRSMPFCRDPSDPAHGNTAIWPATPRLAPAHLWFPCALIVRRRSRSIACVQGRRTGAQYGRSRILSANRTREAASSPLGLDQIPESLLPAIAARLALPVTVLDAAIL